MSRIALGLATLGLFAAGCGADALDLAPTAPTTSVTTSITTTTTTVVLPTVSMAALPEGAFRQGSWLFDVATTTDGRLVSVGATYEEFITDAGIWTSPDGLAWTHIEGDVFGGDGNQVMLGVAVGPAGIVAVGADGRPGDYDAAIWLSSDSATWTSVEDDSLVGPGEQVIWAITNHDGAFVATGESGGTAAVWLSDDGATWARATIDGVQEGGDVGAIYTVTEGGPGLVAAGSAGLEPHPAIWVSPDGTWWTRLDSTSDGSETGVEEADTTPGRFTVIAEGGDGLVAVAATARFDWLTFAQPEVWTSADGYSWSRRSAEFLDTPTATYASVSDLLSTPVGLIAIGGYESIQPGGWDPGMRSIRLSTDGGVTWSVVAEAPVSGWNEPPLAAGARGIQFGDSYLIVGGSAIPTGEEINGYAQLIDVGSVWYVTIEE